MVSKTIAPSTIPGGSTLANASGISTAAVASTNTTKWSNPNAVLLHATALARLRQNSAARDMEPKAFCESCRTKTGASDKNQFTADHKSATRSASGTKIRNTTPGLGSLFEEAKPATIAEPKIPN